MDCLYYAYHDALTDLGLKPKVMDWLIFHTLRMYLQGVERQPIFGGIAPYIVSRMAATHGLHLICQHRLLDKDDYLSIAQRDYKPWYKRMEPVILKTDFGFTGGELDRWYHSIYLNLATQHATYRIVPPALGSCPEEPILRNLSQRTRSEGLFPMDEGRWNGFSAVLRLTVLFSMSSKVSPDVFERYLLFSLERPERT